MKKSASGVIGASIIITMVVGTLSNIQKAQKMPTFRFFFGSAVLWMMLEGLAEFEEEVAKGIAIAIVTFTVLGKGGGVLDHFLGRGAAETVLDTTPPNTDKVAAGIRPDSGTPPVILALAPRPDSGINAVSFQPGIKPVLPTPTPLI